MSEQQDGLPTGKHHQGPGGAETVSEARHAEPGSPAQGAEPSGYKADNPSTAGHGPTAIHSNTPENREGTLNPSAPADAGITPGSAGNH